MKLLLGLVGLSRLCLVVVLLGCATAAPAPTATPSVGCPVRYGGRSATPTERRPARSGHLQPASTARTERLSHRDAHGGRGLGGLWNGPASKR
jgi:hypothetical protein